MGIRAKIKSKLRKVVDAFSGEYSQAAPEKTTPYTKGTKDEHAEVVMAKLNRPKTN